MECLVSIEDGTRYDFVSIEFLDFEIDSTITRGSDAGSKTSDMSWPPMFKNDAAFFSWSHVTFDLSKIAHLILGQKCLKCFFEIRSLSKFLRKTASFLQHYDFSEMWYLIESGFWRHIILCDAKCSYYKHKNYTEYQFYGSNFQASDPLTRIQL